MEEDELKVFYTKVQNEIITTNETIDEYNTLIEESIRLIQDFKGKVKKGKDI